MPRKVELNKEGFSLIESEVEGFLERVVTPIGTSAKADVPKRYLGRRVYVVITKNKGNTIKE
jgi:putative transposon-encoded protein